MAKQMKEATQGIHHKIQQQTTQTLSELEDVAEQNVQDVAKVAQNVQHHNAQRWKSQWGTWTMLLAIVGAFCFCLLTIFTIPKQPNTCLIFSGGQSLLGSIVSRVVKVT
jgi:type VI protein secretion system component VasF